MDQGEYSRPNRTEQLWRHLCGLFGVDAVKRRYGLQPPVEWSAALSHLTDAQLRNGVEKLTKSGASHVPSLPEFLSMCHQAREFHDDSDFERLAAPVFSTWMIAGNQHLLAHILACSKRGQYFDAEGARILAEHKNAWVEDREVDDIGSGVPAEQQKRAWDEIMAAAMARITTTNKPQSVPVRQRDRGTRPLTPWEHWEGEHP